MIRLVFVVAWCLAAVLGAGCRRVSDSAGIEAATETSANTFLNAVGDVKYAGDAACASCHEDEWQRYQSHAMSNSFYPMTGAVSVEEFDAEGVYDPRSGYWYRAVRRGDQFLQEEYRLGPDGLRTHSISRSMDFVVGSGNAARTYMAWELGRLFQLPLTWYSQTRRWALSPGYDRVNKRFDRVISNRCIACHNSYPQAAPFDDGKYASLEHGIGCERCHGPGELHVAARRKDAEVEGIDRTIVNPAHLDSERQLDVCQQCHLNTTISILRAGRTAFDFRPSQRLDDYVALYGDSGSGDTDDIGVISHADRLRQSSCFVEAAAKGESMTCTTCHDPHETFRAQRAGYFDDTCRTCHTDDAFAAARMSEANSRVHLGGTGCAGCHMPFVAAGEAPHTAFTDHRIRVVAAGSEIVDLPESESLKPYFVKDRSGPDADRYAGIANVVAGRQRSNADHYQEGIKRLESFTRERSGDGEARFMIGIGQVALGRIDEAVPNLEAAVAADPGIPERLNALAEAYVASGGDLDEAERLYREALTVQPSLAAIRVNLGRLLQSAGRMSEAETEYRAAIVEMPWLREAHYNLGTVLLATDRLEAARASLDLAIELDPDYGKALANRALVALREEDKAAALRFLERAAVVSPDDAVILGNLGAFLLEDGNLARAIPNLARAIELQPTHFDALMNMAMALVQSRRASEAREYAEAAVRLRPNDERARSLLSSL